MVGECGLISVASTKIRSLSKALWYLHRFLNALANSIEWYSVTIRLLGLQKSRLIRPRNLFFTNAKSPL